MTTYTIAVRREAPPPMTLYVHGEGLHPRMEGVFPKCGVPFLLSTIDDTSRLHVDRL